MFIDSETLIDVQVYISAEKGSIGLVDLNLLTPEQRKILENCCDLPISALSQDLRTAILVQAVQSEKLKMLITATTTGKGKNHVVPDNLRQVSQPEANVFALGD